MLSVTRVSFYSKSHKDGIMNNPQRNRRLFMMSPLARLEMDLSVELSKDLSIDLLVD
jgi:hypothetical protein